MANITGYDLYNAFLSGFVEVKKQREQLNKMNVFPVADGDTGSNLLSTLSSIIEESRASHSFKETMDSMADAALSGARGNSGIIFAQFLNGVNCEINKMETITRETLAESIYRAVPYAYNAIMNPVEGTMITVIRDWSECLYKLKNTMNEVEEYMLHGLEAAKQSLANTPNLLEVLKKSAVVDSGAFGFVLFLEGVLTFVRNKKRGIPALAAETISFEHGDEHIHIQGDLPYRYCTEALMENLKLDTQALKEMLTPLGDSLIVAGSAVKSRIHIHTNESAVLFRRLRNLGTISQQKVDDMKQQYLAANERRHPIAIVTDSIADLPQSLIEEHQIHVIPLNLLIDGSPYLDKLTIEPEDFYQLIQKSKTHPSSSLPSQKTVDNLFSLLTSHYEAVIAIMVSKEMSGTFQSVEKAAQKWVQEGKKIKVIDSKLNSGAEGLLVLEAARQLDQGKNFEEAVTYIENQIRKTKIYVSIKTLKYMVRGGRISPLKGIVGKMVNLKPIVSIDENGKGIAFGKAFTSGGNRDKILDLIKTADREHQIKSFSVVHAHAEPQARELADRVTALLGIQPEYITEISAIVGMNAGVGAIAVSFIQE